MFLATGELFNCVLFASEQAIRFKTSSLVKILTASLEERYPRPDQKVVVATVNLFSAISSDEDQFRPPKKKKDGTGIGLGKRQGQMSHRMSKK
jgi:hypothetical protein